MNIAGVSACDYVHLNPVRAGLLRPGQPLEAKAERLIQEALGAASVSAEQLSGWRKGHLFKLKLARQLRAETTVTMAWIAQRLSMGSRGHLAHLLYKQAYSGVTPSSDHQLTLGIQKMTLSLTDTFSTR